MSNIQGTNVSSPIVPFTTDDDFPTHDAKYGKGGFRSVENLTALNSIPAERKDPGMFVYVNSEEKLYYLKNNAWVEWLGSGGSGTGVSLVFQFSTPATTWTITHNLGLYPSVTTVDSSGEVILGDVTYVDNDTITVDFGEAISGEAYIN